MPSVQVDNQQNRPKGTTPLRAGGSTIRSEQESVGHHDKVVVNGTSVYLLSDTHTDIEIVNDLKPLIEMAYDERKRPVRVVIEMRIHEITKDVLKQIDLKSSDRLADVLATTFKVLNPEVTKVLFRTIAEMKNLGKVQSAEPIGFNERDRDSVKKFDRLYHSKTVLFKAFVDSRSFASAIKPFLGYQKMQNELDTFLSHAQVGELRRLLRDESKQPIVLFVGSKHASYIRRVLNGEDSSEFDAVRPTIQGYLIYKLMADAASSYEQERRKSADVTHLSLEMARFMLYLKVATLIADTRGIPDLSKDEVSKILHIESIAEISDMFENPSKIKTL